MVNNPKLYPLMPSAGDKKVEYIKIPAVMMPNISFTLKRLAAAYPMMNGIK